MRNRVSNRLSGKRNTYGVTYLDYRNTYWCGKYSIPFGLLTTQKIIASAAGK